MFSGSMFDLAIQIITTWQVIAVTVVIVLYVFLINYVSQGYHRPRFVSKTKAKKAAPSEKKAKPLKKSQDEKIDEELGLED